MGRNFSAPNWRNFGPAGGTLTQQLTIRPLKLRSQHFAGEHQVVHFLGGIWLAPILSVSCDTILRHEAIELEMHSWWGPRIVTILLAWEYGSLCSRNTGIDGVTSASGNCLARGICFYPWMDFGRFLTDFDVRLKAGVECTKRRSRALLGRHKYRSDIPIKRACGAGLPMQLAAVSRRP